MHQLLKHQLQSIYGKDFDLTSLDDNMRQLVQKIEKVYLETDREKIFLNQTIGDSTQGPGEVHTSIKKHNEFLKLEIYEKEFLLSQYMEAIGTTLIVSKLDTEGVITYVNDIFCEVSEYSREELVGEPHSIIRSEKTNHEVFSDLWRTVQKKEIWRGTLENRTKSGNYYYVVTAIYPLFDTDGELLEYIDISYDITRSIVSARELEKQRRRNRVIFDSQQNIVVTMTHENGIDNVNSKFLSFLGFDSLDSFRKKHKCICELFVQGDGLLKPSTRDYNWAEPVLENSNIQHKVVLLDSNGQEHTFAVSVTTADFDDESFMIASFTDITEFEIAIDIAEASIQSKADFMANMSHEIRTPMNSIVGFLELMENTLLDSKQQQYLSFMQNSTQMLLAIVDDILDYSKIESGNLELDFTDVNPFVDLESHISSFEIKAKKKNISFLVDIDSSISECIRIDRLRVMQILNNLISNALKFTSSKGTVTVTIKQLSIEDETETIRFAITDNGIGIAKNRLSEIFKSFVQEDGSTARNFGGTGLGLSISSSLCELMGTCLKVNSTQGKGSKFYFDLQVDRCMTTTPLSLQEDNMPIYVAMHNSDTYDFVLRQLTSLKIPFNTIRAQSATLYEKDRKIIIIFECNQYSPQVMLSHTVILINNSDEAVRFAEKYPEVYHLGNYEEMPSSLYDVLVEISGCSSPVPASLDEQFNLSVLVAEDYELNRILIKEVLKAHNITPIFALDGKEALEKASSHNFDIILMDINMPVLNGINSTRQIRKLGISTPIIALTANALEGDEEKYLSEGMDGYLSKPINIDMLVDILKKYSRSPSTRDNKDTSLSDRVSRDNQCVDVIESIFAAQNKMNFSVAIIKKLFDSFTVSSRESLIIMQDALEKNDIEVIRDRAHAIRGSSLFLFFNEIAELCRVLEYGDDVDHEAIIAQLKIHISFLFRNKNKILARLSKSRD